MRKFVKTTAIALALAMIACLAACGNSSTETTETEQTTSKVVEIKIGEYLYKTLGDENLENIQKNLPTTVTFYLDQIGYAKTAEFTEKADIQKIVDMFVKVKVGGETDEFETDQYNNITFEFSDGSQSSIPLCCKNFEFSSDNDYQMYTLEDFDELWEYLESKATTPDGTDTDKETVEETHENDSGDGVVPTYDQETVEIATDEITTEEETTETEAVEEDTEAAEE